MQLGNSSYGTAGYFRLGLLNRSKGGESTMMNQYDNEVFIRDLGCLCQVVLIALLTAAAMGVVR